MTHMCNSCGHDLTWIRAIPDSHYALPVVVCPQCRSACTRRKSPVIKGVRATKAAIRTGIVLAVESIMLVLLSLMSCVMIYGLADDSGTPQDALRLIVDSALRRLDDSIVSNPDLFPTLLVFFAMLSVGAGVWMRSAHGHLRLRSAILLWFSLIVGLMIFPYTRDVILPILNDRPRVQLSLRTELGAAIIYLLFSVPFFAMGLPLGAKGRRIWIKQQHAKRQKYRKKLRKHRMNNARPSH